MSKTKNSKSKFIFIAAAAIAVIAAISALMPESVWNGIFIKTGLNPREYESAPMSVHFVDVGQGDCTVITTDDGETVLIDSGEEIKSDIVIKYLENLSVKKLDYCIVTHPHSDHYGGMLDVLKTYHADNVILPVMSEINTPDDEYYKAFIDYVKSECGSLLFAEAGDSTELTDVRIKYYAPVEQMADLNNMSLVAKILYGNASFLITGDCSEDEEKDILGKYTQTDLKSNVLKIGHHGSKTATGEEWLSVVRPDICVISAGKYNSYNLPSEEMLERLEERNIRYFRTDICGTLVFDCDERGITLR